MNKTKIQLFTLSVIAAATLAACGGNGESSANNTTTPSEVTPASLTLEKIGGFSTNQFDESAAEIPAYDPASKRLFMVNALAGAVDVFDLSDPENPTLIDTLDTNDVLAGSVVNSVAVANGIVAVAIEAPIKTNLGRMALYRASDLTLLSARTVGAQPDMITFTPDGNTVLTANEGEPSDDYQIDPEGSISVIDVRDPRAPIVRTASFSAFTGQEASLRAQGIRIYGPGASASQDFEPEYITVSADGTTAFVTLQENNAIAKIDIATATVTNVFPLGEKDHGAVGNEFDASDSDGDTINIRNWAGVIGLYLPDAMASYTAADGNTYLITANEGDARTWGEDNPAYFAGDASKGFVEEFRVKHLVNRNGWAGRLNDDLPAQLDDLANGGLLNPTVFGYCGAVAGNPNGCRADDQLGRLNVTWTMGYRTDANGAPILFNSTGVEDPAGDRLMYDKLYSFGARSFSIFNEEGVLVFDSGSEIERFLASDDCKVGSTRNLNCKDFFNSGHDEGNALDSRSDAKGPEPEGVAVGKIGDKTFAFIGLERIGGILVYDVTDPSAPVRVDYYNTRDDWTNDPADPAVLPTVGDLGPEGLVFIPAKDSPTGEPLLVVGNEVSGSTAVMRVNLSF